MPSSRFCNPTRNYTKARGPSVEKIRTPGESRPARVGEGAIDGESDEVEKAR